MTATSSAVVARTPAPSVTAAAAGPVTICPKAPKRTFASERFIARPMSIVSSVPDAPTSIPLTMSTFSCRTNPVAAAARPVNALSSEMTTGMSAPPIGSTNRMPNSSAPASSAITSASRWGPTSAPMATRLPANDTAPISAESMIAIPMSALIRPGSGATSWKSASATSAAAPPPTPLKSATICGIAVIFTARAAYAPIGADASITIRIDQSLWTPRWAKVAAMAIPIPAAPIRFPSGAVFGEERNRRARMKATIVTRYARAIASALLIRPSSRPFEHPEHPVGDDEAADDVHRPERDRCESDDANPRGLVREPRDDDRADQDDAVDRVRPGHERCVQHRRHLRDHLEADEDGEHEHRELDDDQRSPHAAATFSRVTHAPAVISSLQSSVSSPSGARCWSNAETLRAYSWLAWNGIVDGTFVSPTRVTPSRSTISPGSVSSQLPPASAPRSTMTEPGRICLTASAGISRGAGRPGTSAVVITTS